jgi:hypothetical protein
MKTIALLAGLLFISFSLNAQSIIDKLFDKYSGAEGYTSVFISKYMFDMFRNNDAVGKPMQKIWNRSSANLGIKILVTDDDPQLNACKREIEGYVFTYRSYGCWKRPGYPSSLQEKKNKVAELLMVIRGRLKVYLSVFRVIST